VVISAIVRLFLEGLSVLKTGKSPTVALADFDFSIGIKR